MVESVTGNDGNIDEVHLQVRCSTEAQQVRRKQQAPAVRKPFFSEVDEASSDLKLALGEKIAAYEKDGPQADDDLDLETPDNSRMVKTVTKEIVRSRRETKSV